MEHQVTCPSGLTGVVRELTVGDISALSGQNSGDVLARLFSKVWLETVELGPYKFEVGKQIPTAEWSKVLLGDRAFLVYKLRELTLGDEFYFQQTCRNCRRRFSWKLNLSELSISGLSPEMIEAMGADGLDATVEVTLPRCGSRVGVKALTGIDQRNVENAASNGQSLEIAALLARLPYIEGATSPAERRGFVMGLHLLDSEFLRQTWERHDIMVQDTIEVECPNCRTVREVQIPVDEHFFSVRSAMPSGENRSTD